MSPASEVLLSFVLSLSYVLAVAIRGFFNRLMPLVVGLVVISSPPLLPVKGPRPVSFTERDSIALLV